MISFRYHIVSLVAVLLALAAGVALGGGPLSEIGRGGDDAAERAEQKNLELNERLDEATLADVFQDEFAEQVSARVVSGALEARPVVVLAMPGTDEATISSITDLVGRAGGSVAAAYAVQPRLVDAGETSLVDKLSSQMLQEVEGLDVPASTPTYDRMGQLIATAVGTTENEGAGIGPTTRDLLGSLRGAEMVTPTGGGELRGSLVLVLLGDEPADPAEVDNIYVGLATGLAAGTDGVSVLGSTGSGEDGLLAALRDDVTFTSNVSSVDTAETVSGQIAGILALAADAGGQTGHYGSSGIDGVVPRG